MTEYRNYVIMDRMGDPVELITGAVESVARRKTRSYIGATYQEVKDQREVGKISDKIRKKLKFKLI